MHRVEIAMQEHRAASEFVAGELQAKVSSLAEMLGKNTALAEDSSQRLARLEATGVYHWQGRFAALESAGATAVRRSEEHQRHLLDLHTAIRTLREEFSNAATFSHGVTAQLNNQESRILKVEANCLEVQRAFAEIEAVRGSLRQLARDVLPVCANRSPLRTRGRSPVRAGGEDEVGGLKLRIMSLEEQLASVRELQLQVVDPRFSDQIKVLTKRVDELKPVLAGGADSGGGPLLVQSTLPHEKVQAICTKKLDTPNCRPDRAMCAMS